MVNRGQNGLWLRYTWYFGERNSEVGALNARLKGKGIRDVYFHVRNIEANGALKYRYSDKAIALNRELQQIAPEVRRIAWVYAGNRSGHGLVDLTDPKVRSRMVAEARWLIRSCGFDGVQWDYEICPDGDPNLLSLLRETRAGIPKGAFLGVAAPVIYPSPLGGFGWSERYYEQLASNCDQVAVMAYDTGAYTPRAYVWLVSQQVVRITRAVAHAGADCKVVLGVPTYGEGTPSHNPRSENLRLALIGVRSGLAGGADLTAWQGIAAFADYTTDESEWRVWDELWPLDKRR